MTKLQTVISKGCIFFSPPMDTRTVAKLFTSPNHKMLGSHRNGRVSPSKGQNLDRFSSDGKN